MANICKQCNKEFGAPATLRIHERTHGESESVAKKVVKAVKKVVKRGK